MSTCSTGLYPARNMDVKDFMSSKSGFTTAGSLCQRSSRSSARFSS
jgi:hypothetical protein